MDIRPIFKVEVRAEGSDKTLVLIDQLNEAEATKVFKQITFPTRGKGYEKLLIWQDEIIMLRAPL